MPGPRPRLWSVYPPGHGPSLMARAPAGIMVRTRDFVRVVGAGFKAGLTLSMRPLMR